MMAKLGNIVVMYLDEKTELKDENIIEITSLQAKFLSSLGTTTQVKS
jgi:hypothetical protein